MCREDCYVIKNFNYNGYVWQKEFEDLFPYDETDDQLQSVEEIKGDMEKPVPMDRLLCGDVGYGKTEVAARAVFKCLAQGKQADLITEDKLNFPFRVNCNIHLINIFCLQNY